MSADVLTGITTGTTMAGNVAQGIYAERAADISAQSMRDQIALVRAESEADIARYAEQAKDFRAKQSLMYLKSGVQLSGSPLDVLDETVRISSENISAMRAKAEAKASNLRAGASNLEAKGRAAFVAGIAGATNTLTSQYGKMASNRAPEPQQGTDYSPGLVTRQNVTNLGFGTGAGRLDLGY